MSPEGDTDVDPVRLEVFANRFMAIAEQMGTRLAGSAQSVNIKERLDFSCALFDRRTVASSPTRRTSPSTSDRWARACATCCGQTPARCSPATCTC
ncbi:MAG: hydantoinase B/oxoprolinase family protein [Ilumatobacteraceae bacterium]